MPQQETEIRAYCKRHGLVLSRNFSDIGKSGGSVNQRAEFLEMIDLTEREENRPAALLVWNFARFSRDVDDSGFFKALLRRRGVLVFSLTDPIPDGQWARVVETIIDISNEEKRRQNSRDVKRALENLVKQGYASGGRPPRGYKAIPVTIGVHKDGRPRVASRWEPDPEIWDLVVLAWNLRAQGKTYGEITRATQGKVYASKTCWVSFFANKTYLGIGKCGDLEVPDHHQAAVTPETWQIVQQLQEASPRRGLRHPRRIAHPSMLSGLAYCAECGSAMVYHAATHRHWPFYICGNHDRRKGTARCGGRRISARKVNPLILDAILSRVLTLDYFEALREKVKSELADTASIDAEIEERKSAHRLAERAVSNLLELAESFGAESVLERLRQKEAERARLAAELRRLEAKREALNVEVSDEALQLVLDTWRAEIIDANEAGDIATLRSLLSRYIQKVELSYTTAKIWYTYPIDSMIQPDESPPRGGTREHVIRHVFLFKRRTAVPIQGMLFRSPCGHKRACHQACFSV